MALKDIFTITRGTQRLLTVMVFIAIVVFIAMFFYYRDINRSEDPRVIEAKIGFEKYNQLMQENQYGLALDILDNLEKIYNNTPGYKNSYEKGLVYNNRASVYLIKVETDHLTAGDNRDAEKIKQYLKSAREYTEKSIDIYQNWLKRMDNIGRKEIYARIYPYFDKEDSAFDGLNLEKIIKKRVEDIILAQVETKRRLSVSYTNLGVIDRYEGKPEDAKKRYEKAIALWKDNYIAKNNLNVLLGKPIKQRSLTERLFPKPDKP
jgi:tetratricopeptide (TPR) repeat protein